MPLNKLLLLLTKVLLPVTKKVLLPLLCCCEELVAALRTTCWSFRNKIATGATAAIAIEQLAAAPSEQVASAANNPPLHDLPPVYARVCASRALLFCSMRSNYMFYLNFPSLLILHHVPIISSF